MHAGIRKSVADMQLVGSNVGGISSNNSHLLFSTSISNRKRKS
jgi:hypothetical protein